MAPHTTLTVTPEMPEQRKRSSSGRDIQNPLEDSCCRTGKDELFFHVNYRRHKLTKHCDIEFCRPGSKRIGIRIAVVLACLHVYSRGFNDFLCTIPDSTVRNGSRSDHFIFSPLDAFVGDDNYKYKYKNDRGALREGEYKFLPDAPNDNSAQGDEPRVLLFITTHMSDEHIWHLKTCWPQVLRTSSLLHNLDVMVYLNPHNESARLGAVHLLSNIFYNQNLTVHIRKSRDMKGIHDFKLLRAAKQSGAMAAMADGTMFQWFHGYDWVIRINPDVIVRDDTFLAKTIINDHNATGLFINCDWRKNLTRVHTDFFALKPGALLPHAFHEPSSSNSEMSFTHDVRPILQNGGHRWIYDAFPHTRLCRAGSGSAFSSILHSHDPDTNATDCPILMERALG